MSSARPSAPAEKFLGVRLTSEELDLLDRWGELSKSETRSDAVRALVRAAARLAPETPSLPVSVRTEIEGFVEDGFARDFAAAFDVVLTLGVDEFARVHADRVPRSRRAAHDLADRRASRRQADREGRELLDR